MGAGAGRVSAPVGWCSPSCYLGPPLPPEMLGLDKCFKAATDVPIFPHPHPPQKPQHSLSPALGVEQQGFGKDKRAPPSPPPMCGDQYTQQRGVSHVGKLQWPWGGEEQGVWGSACVGETMAKKNPVPSLPPSLPPTPLAESDPAPLWEAAGSGQRLPGRWLWQRWPSRCPLPPSHRCQVPPCPPWHEALRPHPVPAVTPRGSDTMHGGCKIQANKTLPQDLPCAA